MAVVSVVAIVAAFGFPKINLHRFRLDAGVRVIQTSLQQAEREAVKRQHNFVVSFDVLGKRVRILDDQNNNNTADGTERVVWRTLDDGIKFHPPPAGFFGGASAEVAGTKLTTVNGYPSIIYRRDGAASTDLQVYITSTRGQNGDFRLLSVTRATGRVDWYRYGSGWKRGSI
jgi:Tfp pilus assembly protein FimT